MKIKYKKVLRPLIKLFFLKNQLYKKIVNLKSLNTLTLQIKKSIKIIYLYNKYKKNILFLGFSNNNKTIQNQLNHSFISKNMYLKNKINFNDFDLIVFNKTKTKDLLLLKTLEKLNIPILIFGDFNYFGYGFNIASKKKIIKAFNSFIIFSILTKNKK